MEMPEKDQAELREAYSSVLRQAQELQTSLGAKLVEFSTDRYPVNGTYLKCLIQGLDEVAAMAELAAERIEEGEPVQA